MYRIAVAAVFAVLMQSAAAAQPPDARTAEAVLAVDESWLKAEIAGDADTLNALLLDGYVSVGPDGKVSTKQALVDGSRRRGKSEKLAQQVAAWKAAHPTRGDVVFFGDTAVLRWVSTNPGEPVSSADVFVFRDGHWRAIYSQHSTAAN